MSPVLSRLLSWVLSDSAKSSPRRRPRREARRRFALSRPQLEVLEDRSLPSAYVVTTTANDGTGSLRDALNQVNAGHYNEIDFSLPWNDPGHVYYQGSVGNVQPVPAASTSDADLTAAAPQWTHSWWSIQPASPLPFIINAVTINGWTQPGFAGSPLIELNGSHAGGASGFEIDSINDTMSVTVCGLDINSFNGSGLLLYNRYTNSGNDVVEGCYLGTDVSGTARMPNGAGITVYTSSNRIGTNGDGVKDAAEGNLISGNNSQGVVLADTGATGNVIAGNRIGTDVTGTQALANGGGGVLLIGGASNNTIGTSGHDVDNAGERNLISGNNLNFVAGISILPGCTNNVVAGNYVGTDVTGTLSLPNSGGGISVDGDYNFIGTDATGFATSATRNVISGNDFMGIGIGSDHNVVAGNFIGTDPTGMQFNANGGYGIFMPGGQYNQIGTNGDGVNDAAEGNVLCDTFIDVLMGGNAYNVFAGNKIGTDVTGTQALCRNFAGFDIGSGSHDNRIGVNGADPDPTAERNVISGHADFDIYDEVAGVSNNVIAGNYIGTDITGQHSLGDGNGIAISGDHNRIGTTSDATANPVEGNIIARGVGLGRTSAIGNVVAGNIIGMDASGTAAFSDGGGVGLAGGATDNIIGGNVAAARNIIALGVEIYGGGTDNNWVKGNFIGTNLSGTAALPNGNGDVLVIDGASGNTIGGSSAGEGNVITGNGIVGNPAFDNCVTIMDDPTNTTPMVGNAILGNVLTNGINGVFIVNASAGISGTIVGMPGAGNVISGNVQNGIQVNGSTGTVIQANLIGTNAAGTAAFANGADGIQIQYGSNNTIGGTSPGQGNTIAYNAGDGVHLLAAYSTSSISILGNSIHDNAGPGIKLDNGSNNNQAAPGLTTALSGLGITVVTGTITSAHSATVRVEFFANVAGDPEGRTLLGSCSVPTDAAGNGSFTAVLSAAVPAGQNLVTATVTDPSGNTSQFSAGVVATPIPPASLSGVVWEDFNNDGQVDFGESGISGVTITLTGTDFLGRAVNLSPQTTDSSGAYVFLNLLPGNYYLTETPPAGYTQGIDSVGTAGGSVSAPDQFAVALGLGVNGLNYNFGEQPPAGSGVHHGQTAGIGFWNNKNGQALIKSLNGGGADGHGSHQLGDWLAATLPHTFGANASSNNLAGKDNAYVAALFQSDFVMKGVKLDAQLLATALSVYATNTALDPTQVAATYGFTVSGDGAGTATISVGSNGDAFGVANNSTRTLMDLLLAADAQAVNGVLYGGNATRRNEANNVFSAVNQDGGL
jgi:titin